MKTEKRCQFFCEDGIMTTMEDTNPFELNLSGLIPLIEKQFPGDKVKFFTFSIRAVGLLVEDWIEVSTVFLS